MQDIVLLVSSDTEGLDSSRRVMTEAGLRVERQQARVADGDIPAACRAVLADVALGLPALTALVAAAAGRPVVIADVDGVGERPERFLEAGASDYLRGEECADERLLFALRKATAREQGRTTVWRRIRLLRTLFGIVADGKLSVAEQIERILHTGCELFSVDEGVLSYVEEGFYVIEHAWSRDERSRAGQHFALSDTACALTLKNGATTAVADLGERLGASHPAVLRDQHAYLGVPVTVAGKRYGTLAFASRTARERSFSREDTGLAATLGDWLGSLLTRSQMLGEMHLLATYDALTSLPNRSSLLEKMERSIEHCRHTARNPFAVLFMDLDGFKGVNDRCGHLAGDELLAAVARRLESLLLPKDIIARYAGDEFVVLLEDVDLEQAVMVARRIRTALGEPFALRLQSVSVGVSVGVVLHSDETDAGALIRAADAAMYRAKQSGSGVAVADTGLAVA